MIETQAEKEKLTFAKASNSVARIELGHPSRLRGWTAGSSQWAGLRTQGGDRA